MVLVGDVKDRTTILVDDMADTSGTLILAAKRSFEFVISLTTLQIKGSWF